MTATVPETDHEKKKCVVCDNEIPRDMKKECPVCHFDPDGKQCDHCKKRLPIGASFCNECKVYQGLRRYFNIAAIVLSLMTASFGVFRGLYLAATYLSDRNSYTRFKVTSADDRHVYLQVWNTGQKPSTLVGYHLKFDAKLPIKDTTLQLSEDDAVEARNVIVNGKPVKIGLTTGTESLEILPNAGQEQNTKEKISKLLSAQTVVLDIDVEESDDPSEGFCHWVESRKFHTRSDAFSVDRIKPFLVWNMR